MIYNTGIYKITNLTNSKFYIGSAATIKKRWWDHKRELNKNTHRNIHLQRAYNKYSISSFSFEVILFCSKEDLLFFEQRCIDILKPDYNICKVAGSQLGTYHTEESKRKISLASLGKVTSAQTKIKMSEAAFGRKHTESTKKKMSDSAKNRVRHNKSPDSVLEGA